MNGEIWAVTAYFNPAGYQNKRWNYLHFADVLRAQGAKLLVVEAAIGHADFEVPITSADAVCQLRTEAALWHKERLLNIGISALPRTCDRVVCLDADVVFVESSWMAETATVLTYYPSVQPYATAWRLGPGGTTIRDAIVERGARQHLGGAFALSQGVKKRYMPGHPGFAWAARRELLATYGLYDKCILGGGDMTAALAMSMPASAEPFRNWLQDTTSPSLREDIVRWADQMYDAVAGRVAYVEGVLLHLWHGERENRRYNTRARILIDHQFDPLSDIRANQCGCWEWRGNKPALAVAVKEYFVDRREDVPTPADREQWKTQG